MRVLILACMLTAVTCFVPMPAAVQRRRSSPIAREDRKVQQSNVSPPRSAFLTSRQGLFGLGVAEIGVILAIGTFVLGPDKLAEFAKDFGKVAGELKEVPKEFSAGLEEGKVAAEVTKAIVDAEDAAVADSKEP